MRDDSFSSLIGDLEKSRMSRRRLFGLGGSAMAGALGASTLSTLFAPGAVAATDDYKALVCLFLFGGNDGMNMVVPRDLTRHNQYKAVRGPLALDRARLVPLNADYGLHPAMSALTQAWNDRALAPVHNVGPLFAPLTKAQYRAAATGDPLVPESLFSHSDQQSLWSAAVSRVFERTGWGGRAAQALSTTNPVISFGGNAHFGLTQTQAPWVLPGPGSNFGVDGFYNDEPVNARRAALNAIMREKQGSPVAEAYARVQRNAFDLENQLSHLFEFDPNPAADASGVTKAFEPLINNGSIASSLARQLFQVARFVAERATVQGTRQIFFVQMGGFDNHSEQIAGSVEEGVHAELMKDLADGCAAFWRALKALNMSNQVTLFTQSDFGRTFAHNESLGTDHAWGNEQLVMGGAVGGGATYGRYPTLEIRGPDDVGLEEWEGEGRWIPTLSVDQYAATLLRWWGLTEGQLDLTLPNLRNFGSARNIGFMPA